MLLFSQSTIAAHHLTPHQQRPQRLNLAYCRSMIFFRKPVSTFRDHALGLAKSVIRRPPARNVPLNRLNVGGKPL
jgi:hypothetical protein